MKFTEGIAFSPLGKGNLLRRGKGKAITWLPKRGARERLQNPEVKTQGKAAPLNRKKHLVQRRGDWRASFREGGDFVIFGKEGRKKCDADSLNNGVQEGLHVNLRKPLVEDKYHPAPVTKQAR